MGEVRSWGWRHGGGIAGSSPDRVTTAGPWPTAAPTVLAEWRSTLLPAICSAAASAAPPPARAVPPAAAAPASPASGSSGSLRVRWCVGVTGAAWPLPRGAMPKEDVPHSGSTPESSTPDARSAPTSSTTSLSRDDCAVHVVLSESWEPSA